MILVTGATGHLGNVLVRTLCAQGERVRALVLPNDACPALADLDVECVTGNVLDPASLNAALRDVELVYHLAGIVSIVPSRTDLMWRVNVEGVHNLAQAALQSNVRRVVYVSSIHAFKTLPQGTVVDETAPLALAAPPEVYNRTKAEGTVRMLDAVAQGLDAVIVCPTGIIGPHDYLQSEMGLLIRSFAQRRVHVLIDGGYDFVDVRDVVGGLRQAAQGGERGELYILSGFNTPLTHMRRIVQELAGIHTPALIVPFRLAKAAARLMERLYRWTGSVPRFTAYSLNTVRENVCFSHEKATQTFGYHPRPLRETLTDLLAWYNQREVGLRAPLPGRPSPAR